MKVDLADRVALVTGAARGIGQGIADVLAANGAVVYYSDVDIEEVHRAAARHPARKRWKWTSAMSNRYNR